MLALINPNVRRKYSLEELKLRFVRPTLDQATVLREVYLTAHTAYKSKAVAEFGRELTVTALVNQMEEGGMSPRLPMDLWLSVALDLIPREARDLVAVADTGLRTSALRRME